jgi:hypothetical protein
MEKPDDVNQNQNTNMRSASLLNQDERAAEEFQSSGPTAHLYTETGEEWHSESDSEQIKKWSELLEGTKGQLKCGSDLLLSMQLADEETETEEGYDEEKELSTEIVEKFKVARASEDQMSLDDQLKTQKTEAWGQFWL